MDSYVICNQSGEDKTCSNKYAPEYSAADHSFYFMDLGSLQCWLWTSCFIIFDTIKPFLIILESDTEICHFDEVENIFVKMKK